MVLVEGNYLLLDEGPWAGGRAARSSAWPVEAPAEVRRDRSLARQVRPQARPCVTALDRDGRGAERQIGSTKERATTTWWCRASWPDRRVVTTAGHGRRRTSRRQVARGPALRRIAVAERAADAGDTAASAGRWANQECGILALPTTADDIDDFVSTYRRSASQRPLAIEQEGSTVLNSRRRAPPTRAIRSCCSESSRPCDGATGDRRSQLAAGQLRRRLGNVATIGANWPPPAPPPAGGGTAGLPTLRISCRLRLTLSHSPYSTACSAVNQRSRRSRPGSARVACRSAGRSAWPCAASCRRAARPGWRCRRPGRGGRRAAGAS